MVSVQVQLVLYVGALALGDMASASCLSHPTHNTHTSLKCRLWCRCSFFCM